MKNIAFTTIALVSTLVLAGCGKKTSNQDTESAALPITIEQSLAPETHKWYAFSQQGMESVDLPQHANSLLKRPWTEAIRISSMGSAVKSVDGKDGSMQKTAVPPAYATVNRLGMLIFDGNEPKLVKDASFFANVSAGNLVFFGDTPIFSLHKNSFFNTNESESSEPFLVKYDRASGVCIPIVSYQNLMIDKNSQITDFTWNGVEWICAVKTQAEENRVIFNYIKWTPGADISELSPAKNNNRIAISEAEESEFRNTKIPLDFSLAPERLRNLLQVIPADFGFHIECFHTSGFSPITYAHGATEDGFGGTALLGDTYAMAVFQDGTTYLSGALYGKNILGREKAVAFRLPKLPENYVYSGFAISGTNLYVAWEEVDFYQTGRSGFLSVDLDKVLYNN